MKYKKKKFYVISRKPEQCSFCCLPDYGYIVAIAYVDGDIYCAFFDKLLYTEKGIKNQKKIKLYSIYPLKEVL